MTLGLLLMSHLAKKPRLFKKGSFDPIVRGAPHTLLLGTQPSDNSLLHSGYFMTNANCFWHIVGDALGFRRGFHIGRSEAVDYIRPHLLHDEAVDYDEAVRRLTEAGYALWDIVAESERKGSLDAAIRNAKHTDLRKLVTEHPTIKRICFSTGRDSARRFKRAHKDWIASGAFVARDDENTRAVFGDLRGGFIELCVMESVSPAANPRQTWSTEKQKASGFDDEWTERPAALYPWKRHCWFEACFNDEPHVKAAPPFGSRPTDFRR